MSAEELAGGSFVTLLAFPAASIIPVLPWGFSLVCWVAESWRSSRASALSGHCGCFPGAGLKQGVEGLASFEENREKSGSFG